MKRTQYKWTLPEAIEARLGESSYGRQRSIFEEDHLFIVLHDVPKLDQFEREAVLFLRTPEGDYLSNGRDNGKWKLKDLIGAYERKFEELEKEQQQCLSTDELYNLLEVLTPINRAIQNQYATLQSARDYVKGDSFLISMRDESYEISRNFELLAGEVKLKLERKISKNAEKQSIQTQEMAKSQHKLNVLAAITFPLMAIATLMGMDLKHGLENQPVPLFWSIAAFGMMVGFFVRGWVIKK